jgi:hypothetical protein
MTDQQKVPAVAAAPNPPDELMATIYELISLGLATCQHQGAPHRLWWHETSVEALRHAVDCAYQEITDRITKHEEDVRRSRTATYEAQVRAVRERDT